MIIKNNPLLFGGQGLLGNILVRMVRGKIVVSNRPSKPTRETKRQRLNRDGFRAATRYAKLCMQDKEKKAFYKEKADELGLTNAYTAAITVYLRMRKDDMEKVKRENVKK